MLSLKRSLIVSIREAPVVAERRRRITPILSLEVDLKNDSPNRVMRDQIPYLTGGWRSNRVDVGDDHTMRKGLIRQKQ